MEKSDRRKFLKQASLLVGTGICVTCASSFLNSCEQDIIIPPVPKYTGKQTIPISGALANDYGFLEYSFSYYLDGKTYSKTILIVNEGGGVFQAFDNKCPHWGVPIAVQASSKDIKCSVHATLFELSTGAVKQNGSGGALNPLGTYTTKVVGTNVEVTFGDK
ncbi:MAG: Rieske (2Fe-2S) protein [Candidatus Kapabacteria bacterium]|nr:Rieske (2Fe-2S) protein [Candidatus Kapabacteria bacterium]